MWSNNDFIRIPFAFYNIHYFLVSVPRSRWLLMIGVNHQGDKNGNKTQDVPAARIMKPNISRRKPKGFASCKEIEKSDKENQIIA